MLSVKSDDSYGLHEIYFWKSVGWPEEGKGVAFVLILRTCLVGD